MAVSGGGSPTCLPTSITWELSKKYGFLSPTPGVQTQSVWGRALKWVIFHLLPKWLWSPAVTYSLILGATSRAQ